MENSEYQMESKANRRFTVSSTRIGRLRERKKGPTGEKSPFHSLTSPVSLRSHRALKPAVGNVLRPEIAPTNPSVWPQAFASVLVNNNYFPVRGGITAEMSRVSQNNITVRHRSGLPPSQVEFAYIVGPVSVAAPELVRELRNRSQLFVFV